MKRGSDEAEKSKSTGLTHKDLEIWKLGIDIVEVIYKVTEMFPQRDYGLISDMRRAAVSVPSNIAEGAARNSRKEFIYFLYVSLGSLSELETQVTIANRLGYIADEQGVSELIEKERRKLLNYIRYQKGRS
jgi:four helix bundle protein